jgi:glycogen operon protein
VVRHFSISPGEPYPLGATVTPDGINFSLFSQNATGVELLLFKRYDDLQPFQIIPFHPHINKSFFYWHVFLEGADEGLIYAYRLDGPFNPAGGHRFNPRKVLLDPYSKGVVYNHNWSRAEASGPEENVHSAMKSLVVDEHRYKWNGVKSPGYHLSDSILYEMHVRGFTKHPSSKVKHPGTFDGIVEKIPYLKQLGVTTIELLPIHQFDMHENSNRNPITGEKLVNFWGYNSICFFSPHRGYYIEGWETMHYLTGFRDMVKALHKAGLEIILDVVFNHTGEGDEKGPTISFKGIENSVYYLLDSADRSNYLNYSGCGNTVNCNHPLVRRMILDSLRYWVTTMHVDGFRFDLASILSRDETGKPMTNPPLLWEIESDPILQKTKIIAEAWDAAGLYQVGAFPGERWAEWNGRYRDDVRQFVRGDNGMVEGFAARLAGSPDLYARLSREPYQSVNYVTCHDGFTLRDLVSYEKKHNLSNGENNEDGQPENHSCNYGKEGPSKALEELRIRQMKNFTAILMLSQGTPMILAGDEVGRTQRGNNNAYCHDNEITWFNWNLLKTEKELLRFFRLMIAFRKSHPTLRRREYFWGQKNAQGWSEINWHGIHLNQPDLGYYSHSIAFTLAGFDQYPDIHAMINCWTSPLEFEIPRLPAGKLWLRSVDTGLASPDDIAEEGTEPPVEKDRYLVDQRSVAVLISAKTP